MNQKNDGVLSLIVFCFAEFLESLLNFNACYLLVIFFCREKKGFDLNLAEAIYNSFQNKDKI